MRVCVAFIGGFKVVGGIHHALYLSDNGLRE